LNNANNENMILQKQDYENAATHIGSAITKIGDILTLLSDTECFQDTNITSIIRKLEELDNDLTSTKNKLLLRINDNN